MSTEKSNALIEMAGYVEDKETRQRGILLAIIHDDQRVVEAAAMYLLEVVGPSMARGLPAITALLNVVDARKGEERADEAARVEARVEARVTAGEGASDAQKVIDAIVASVRSANPGADRPQ